MGGPPRRTSCLVAESPGFTGLGAPSLPGFPFSPLPGQCVHSQPWLRALTNRVAPLMRGRPGCRRCRARATGLRLVRGAMRHYCLGRCSALVVCVRRSRPVRGGWGRCRVLCLPCFPLPAPRFLRCVWRAVPSGCPLSSLPCSLCVPRARSGCPSGFPRVSFVCVCACALAASAPPPPPPRVGVARAPRAVPVLGAGRAVPLGPCPSACPASVPCSVWLAWGGAARSRFPLHGLGLRAPHGVGAGVGTRHQPHRARSCELALRAGLARCRGGTRAPGGGASCLGAGHPGSGALRPLTTRPFGRAAGAHYPLAVAAGGAGAGTRHQPHNALLRAGFARCGGSMKVPGGGASCLGVGRPGSGALPTPTTRPFGRAAGAHHPVAVGAGGAGVGTSQQPHSARSCELALRAVGAA